MSLQYLHMLLTLATVNNRYEKRVRLLYLFLLFSLAVICYCVLLQISNYLLMSFNSNF